VLIAIASACFIGPLLPGVPAPTGGSALEADQPLLSVGHLLGTDPNGNDELARLLYGGRASLRIALAVNVLGLLLGGSLGAMAGLLGGALDAISMRLTDVLIAFPSLVLVIAVGQVLGPSEPHTVFALSFYSVPAFVRLARLATLRLKDRPFMLAATLSGARPASVLAEHVVPNILPQLLTFAALGMGFAIILEGALGFLGLGIRAPAPSWGNMIAQGGQVLATNATLLLLPGALLLLTVLSFNLLADALRAQWDFLDRS
jgi:peptide/nickel transport system permease protein